MSSAFIYKVQDYQESSKLLFCYTPYGKKTLIAKGAKNYKNAYHSFTDYFTLLECELSETKTMESLRKGKLLNDYTHYKTLSNSKYLKGFTEAINNLVTDDLAHERLFKMLLILLDFENLELALTTFYVKLTYALGYELTFYKNDYKGFNLKLGKTVLKNESLSVDLNLEETNILKEIYFMKEEIKIDNGILSKIKQFVASYYKYHLDYKIEV